MADIWRLIDSGLGSPARNVALNRALLEARCADEIPGTLRFARFTRCALLAFQQSAVQELDLDYCRAQAIPIQRRLTGGAACYVDERQLVWELYLHRRDVGAAALSSVAKRVCHAAATALSALGIDARYRPRADIEVDGRAVASGSFTVEREAILFQGILLIDGDIAEGFRALRTPWTGSAEELKVETGKRAASLKEALGRKPDLALVKHNLTEAFESEFEVEFREGDLGLSEQARYDAAIRQVDSSDWIDHIARAVSEAPLIEATHHAAAGQLRAVVRYERQTRTIKQVWFAGNAVLEPSRALYDLEAALRDVPVGRVAQRVEWFFASRPVDTGFLPRDFVTVLLQATRQRLLAGNP